MRRIRIDFPESGSAEEVSRLLTEASESERVQAAILLWSRGDMGRVRDGVELAALDWRDVLMRAELADDDWTDRLDSELGATQAR